MSIIAKQTGHKLGAYETDSGYSLELLYPGKMSAKVMHYVLQEILSLLHNSLLCARLFHVHVMLAQMMLADTG